MPLYEYECEQCGRFELIQKFSDAPLQTCPTCGKAVEKLLSSPAIQFKGSGWYITDYARKSGNGGKSEGAKSESSSKDSGSKDSGSKSGETKSSETSTAKTGSDKS
jgi:putative FmdB family regulatory protein